MIPKLALCNFLSDPRDLKALAFEYGFSGVDWSFDLKSVPDSPLAEAHWAETVSALGPLEIRYHCPFYKLDLGHDDPAEAEKRLRSGIKGTPYYYRWELERGYRLLAESLQRQGENRESEFYRLLSDSLHGAADAYQAFIKLAEDRIAEQDLDTASRVTGLLEGMFPNNTRIIIARARIDIFKGYASRAVEKLNRQLENTPAKFIADKVEGYKVLARAYKNLGDWESSRRSLEQSDLIARSL